MKKLLLIPMFVFGLLSCTSNEDSINNEDDSLSEIRAQYDSYKISTQEGISQAYQVLAGSKSRSEDTSAISGNELIQLLTSLPVETVDSLYAVYCTPQIEEEYDSIYDGAVENLIEQSSLEEVSQFYDFTDNYIEIGGHNLDMLAEAVKGKSPIIQKCMIASAASIDEYIGSEPETRGADAYCLNQLKLQMAKSMVQSTVMDAGGALLVGSIGVPGVDVATALFLAGYDLFSSIDMAYQYHRCCATHVS